MTGRLLVIDGQISMTSEKCFSCDHFSDEKRVGNLEKYCSGYVVRVKIPDEGFCDLKKRDVKGDDRCSHWKLDRKLKALLG